MVTSGIRESYVPGSLPYDRVELNLDKKKYYQMHRNAVVLLSGNGEVVGANTGTGTQSEVGKIAIETMALDKLEFEIETQDPREARSTTFVTGELVTGTYGTAKTFTVADASIFRPFDLIVNETTGEQLLITAVDTTTSPDEITAYPAFESTGFTGETSFPLTTTNGTPQAKTNGDVITIIGNAMPEGSGAQSIIDTDPVADLQYMQTFRQEFGETYEKSRTSQRAYQGIDDMGERAKSNLLVKMERAILRSKLNKQTTVAAGEGTARTMQGMKSTVSTYNQAASALVGGGNDLTVPKLDQIIDQLSDKNRSGRLIGLANGTTIRKFRELMDNKVTVNVEVGSKEFGLQSLVYQGQLPLSFIQHEVMDDIADELFVFDPATFEIVNLDGDAVGLESDKRDIPGTNENARREIKDAYTGSYSVKYIDEAANSVITGLTHTISG